MAIIRYVLAALKPGVDPKEYEQWERTVCYPEIAKSFRTIVSYRTHRIANPMEGISGGPWDYIERIELTAREPYLQELSSMDNKELMYGYERYIDRSKSVVIWTDSIEP